MMTDNKTNFAQCENSHPLFLVRRSFELNVNTILYLAKHYSILLE